MNIWVLTLCINATWAGCGSYKEFEFSTKQECYEALAAMKIDVNGKVAVGENGKTTIALCVPKQSNQK